MIEKTLSLDLAKHEAEIQKIREQLLRPIASKFGYPLGQKSMAVGLPTVLCLGNHSSGKSTFINHLSGEPIQLTGVAPTDDGFTLITYGEREETIDGRATVADPTLPYRNFEQFGKDFLDHLKLKRRPVENLRNVCLIDSPGLIDHAGSRNDHGRGYDFNAVVRAFADSADLVIFFFDPDKPGTTGESLRVFTDALSDVMYKLLIVFNKVDTFSDVRDFARTYGSLCWNLSRVVRTKDMPHIYCTFVEGQASASARQIDLSDFEKSTDELRHEISRVSERRRSNLVGAVLDSARQLRIHAAVVRHVGGKLMKMRLLTFFVGLLGLAAGGYLMWYHRENQYLLVTAILSLVIGCIGLFGSQLFVNLHRSRLIGKLDAIFHDIFSAERNENQNSQHLDGLWNSVKPRTIQFLQESRLRNIPFSSLWNRKLKKLKRAAEVDIPNMLGKR